MAGLRLRRGRTRPMRWLGLGLVALLLTPMAAAVPFLQHRADAGRTGLVLDQGPASFDIAFALALPGLRGNGAPPVIIGGAVYVLTTASEVESPYNRTALWRIDLATAQAQVLVDLSDAGSASSLSSDGQRLFVSTRSWVQAYLLDGEPLWPQPFELPRVMTPSPDETTCALAAVDGGQLFLPCHQYTLRRTFQYPTAPPGGRLQPLRA